MKSFFTPLILVFFLATSCSPVHSYALDNIPKNGILGADISVYQGNFNFKKAKESGIKFVMLRAGYGQEPYPGEKNRHGKFIDQVDKQFYNNLLNAKEANMPIGAYHYTYANSPEKAKLEAEYLIKILECSNIQSCKTILNSQKVKTKIGSPVQFEFPIAIDVEDPSLTKIGKDKLTKSIAIMCKILKEHGYYTIIYTGKYFSEKYLDLSKIDYDDLWLALYPKDVTNRDYSDRAGMWQFCSNASGSKYGAQSKYIDLNVCYKDYIDIIVKRGGNPIKSYYT